MPFFSQILNFLDYIKRELKPNLAIIAPKFKKGEIYESFYEKTGRPYISRYVFALYNAHHKHLHGDKSERASSWRHGCGQSSDGPFYDHF